MWVAAASVVAYVLGAATDAERTAMLADVHAPALVDAEVTQTLGGLVRGAKTELATAELARTDLRQLALRRYPDSPLLRRCWELRDVCSTCDALYVALAEVLDAKLVTRDAPLAGGVGTLVDVVLA